MVVLGYFHFVDNFSRLGTQGSSSNVGALAHVRDVGITFQFNFNSKYPA